MAGRWFVHRNDQQLGPYRADEVRQGLRDGLFDPFDLISREGSHVRVELMEIDEIFMHSQIEYMPSVSEQAEARPLDQAAGGGGGAFLGGAAAEVNPQRLAVVPGNLLADAAAAKRGAKRGKGDSPKRFFLVETSGRIIGPMAAAEIQAAWARGGLDKNLMVQKNNSPAKVPIAKFVHLYAMAKLTGAQGAAPVTSPMLSQMIRVEANRLGRFRKWLFPALGAVVLGLAIAVAYMFFTSGKRRSDFSTRRPVSAQIAKKPAVVAPKPVKVVAPTPTPKAVSSRPVTRPVAPAMRRPELRPVAPAVTRPVTRPQAPRPQAPRPQAPSTMPPAKVPVEAPRTQWRPPPTQKPVVARAPRPVAVTPPATQQMARQPAPPPTNAGPAASAIGDITGATFNRAELEACAMKCKIRFNARGEQIDVVFFKGAFEDQLKARQGPVTLTGRINQEAGGGRTMYLQGVK